jgi:glyoxylase-like metal-dependent hydrolase (beta-lactamase superfamily II)
MRAPRLLVAAAALALVAGAAPAQQDFSKVEMKATHVAGGIHMLEGSGGNIGVSVGRDGILIVDDQFAPLADKIRAALQKLGEGKLRFILNTHWHGDHTGGNAVFGPEAPIIAHANVRRRLESGMDAPGRQVPPAPREALPVVTFDHSLSIHFNDEEIRAIHFAHGHTDGDSVIVFTKSNVVHMGDHFFNGKFPFVDLASGGDVEGYARNVEAVIKQVPADAKVIPGHGPLARRRRARRRAREAECDGADHEAHEQPDRCAPPGGDGCCRHRYSFASRRRACCWLLGGRSDGHIVPRCALPPQWVDPASRSTASRKSRRSRLPPKREAGPVEP